MRSSAARTSRRRALAGVQRAAVRVEARVDVGVVVEAHVARRSRCGRAARRPPRTPRARRRPRRPGRRSATPSCAEASASSRPGQRASSAGVVVGGVDHAAREHVHAPERGARVAAEHEHLERPLGVVAVADEHHGGAVARRHGAAVIGSRLGRSGGSGRSSQLSTSQTSSPRRAGRRVGDRGDHLEQPAARPGCGAARPRGRPRGTAAGAAGSRGSRRGTRA